MSFYTLPATMEIRVAANEFSVPQWLQRCPEAPVAQQARPSHKQRRWLGTAVLAMLIVSFLLALIPFRGYLGTDEVRVESGRVEIPLSALPAERVREVAWNRERLFITPGDVPVVIAVAYESGAYLLPDGAAAGGHVRCGLFGAVGERFRCMDPSVPADWRGRAAWSLRGEPLGEGFPTLRSMAYRIAGNTLVITAMEETE